MRAGRFGRNVGAKDIMDIERPRPGRRTYGPQKDSINDPINDPIKLDERYG